MEAADDGRRPAARPARASGATSSIDGRRIQAGGVSWRVHCEGQGPVLLLLHGTGSSFASWRDLFPLLAPTFTVVAPDLPGHGGSSLIRGRPSSLPAMAEALRGLLVEMDVSPVFVAGHSAGAAISARLALDERSTVRRLAWLAPALRPFGGLAGSLAPALAGVLARNPLVPRLAAWRAGSESAVRRLIATTGSSLDERGVQAYAALLRQPSHVAGALAMMADWDLAPLQRDLARLAVPVLILHGELDQTVPAWQSDDVAARMPHARAQRLAAVGHLAHEERPREVTELLTSWFER